MYFAKRSITISKVFYTGKCWRVLHLNPPPHTLLKIGPKQGVRNKLFCCLINDSLQLRNNIYVKINVLSTCFLTLKKLNLSFFCCLKLLHQILHANLHYKTRFKCTHISSSFELMQIYQIYLSSVVCDGKQNSFSHKNNLKMISVYINQIYS